MALFPNVRVAPDPEGGFDFTPASPQRAKVSIRYRPRQFAPALGGRVGREPDRWAIRVQSLSAVLQSNKAKELKALDNAA